MEYFTSDISKAEFPISAKVNGRIVRPGVLKEIQKDHPDFTEESQLCISELNHYRQKYIQNLLSDEVGNLTELEKTVLQNITENRLITTDISDLNAPMTKGQILADKIAAFGGSWRFIFLFGFFILLWMLLNIILLRDKGFDPYPFILLNLILSCIAAIQAPVIMMSQNRMEEKDRERSKNDYMVNLKSEVEIRMLHEKIDHLILTQQENLMEIQQIQVDMMREIMDKMDSDEKVL